MAVKRKKEVRMASFLGRSIAQNAAGKVGPAMRVAETGLNYYSNRIIQALQPYATLDASLIVISLRHIADEIEKDNPGTAETVGRLSECLKFPELKQTSRVAKPNTYKE